ncbi:MAG TPA: hypothetical protein V6D20_13750 [Candidatus Obscuribacterales bacterium]
MRIDGRKQQRSPPRRQNLGNASMMAKLSTSLLRVTKPSAHPRFSGSDR